MAKRFNDVLNSLRMADEGIVQQLVGQFQSDVMAALRNHKDVTDSNLVLYVTQAMPVACGQMPQNHYAPLVKRIVEEDAIVQESLRPLRGALTMLKEIHKAHYPEFYPNEEIHSIEDALGGARDWLRENAEFIANGDIEDSITAELDRIEDAINPSRVMQR